MKNERIVVALILSIGMVLAAWMISHNGRGDGMTRVTWFSSPEAKLVLLDMDRRGPNKTVPTATVREFGRLLDELEHYCREPRRQIADMTLAARDSLEAWYGWSRWIHDMLRTEVVETRTEGSDHSCEHRFLNVVNQLGVWWKF